MEIYLGNTIEASCYFLLGNVVFTSLHIWLVTVQPSLLIDCQRRQLVLK